MSIIFADQFFDNPQLHQAVTDFCRSLPEYQSARQQWEATVAKVRPFLDFDLYDQMETDLLRYTNYEVYAYYAFGLGLRQELIRQLML